MRTLTASAFRGRGMSLEEKWPEAEPAVAAPSAPARRRRVHPATWVAAAVLLPLVCWDASQARHHVQLRRQPAAPHVEPSPSPPSPFPPTRSPRLSPLT